MTLIVDTTAVAYPSVDGTAFPAPGSTLPAAGTAAPAFEAATDAATDAATNAAAMTAPACIVPSAKRAFMFQSRPWHFTPPRDLTRL